MTVLIKGLHVANITLYLGFFPASQPSHLLAENEGMGQHPRERSLLLGVFLCYLPSRFRAVFSGIPPVCWS